MIEPLCFQFNWPRKIFRRFLGVIFQQSNEYIQIFIAELLHDLTDALQLCPGLWNRLP